MTERSSMTALVNRLRLLVGDPAGLTETFSFEQIQDALDAHRVEVLQLPLTPRPSIVNGITSYREFYAPRGMWEADEVLVDSNYLTIAPSTSDRLVGHWTLATSKTPPVYITGKVYDLYGAAVDVLEQWAARFKAEFDFATDSQTFARSQKSLQVEALAATYRRRARPPAIRFVSSDTW
ncbi:MAG: hypothetical protein WAN48_11445 [Actinomycetes bacterium]